MCLLANCVRNQAQAEVIEKFSKIIKRYLGLTPQQLGNLPYEQAMDTAIAQRTPFVVKYPASGYMIQLQEIAKRIIIQ